ncbi:hypothetical protein DFP72DRAFT_905710 [Ephemerocybe angulata]|uniref:Secreted protein n=1 Tax=Ephemerocybe angulata TaxID=980116 RepID=A0A8H6HRQ3_9AGAR|nr:hypothetical protein DFP72DRAFT_905710 [Tulosesus angulatus]
MAARSFLMLLPDKALALSVSSTASIISSTEFGRMYSYAMASMTASMDLLLCSTRRNLSEISFFLVSSSSLGGFAGSI